MAKYPVLVCQQLKLKRLLRKKDIPEEAEHIMNIKLNKQIFHLFKDKKGGYYFYNIHNGKWSELINDIWKE